MKLGTRDLPRRRRWIAAALADVARSAAAKVKAPDVTVPEPVRASRAAAGDAAREERLAAYGSRAACTPRATWRPVEEEDEELVA